MPYSTFEFLYEAMVKAKATERLNDLDLHIYAHSKPENTKKIHKKLYEQALPESEKKEKIVTTKDLMKFGIDAMAVK